MSDELLKERVFNGTCRNAYGESSGDRYILRVESHNSWLFVLQAQRKHLRIDVKIEKPEHGKLMTWRKHIFREAVCGNTICINESKVIVPRKP